MTKWQKVIVAVGCACFLGLLVYAPWRWEDNDGTTGPFGYHFFFDPPRPRYIGASLDVPRLLIPMGVVVLVTVAGVFLVAPKQYTPTPPPADWRDKW